MLLFIMTEMKISEKRITGDWIDLREASKDFYTLLEYLKPDKELIKKQINLINQSVEEGLIEYKYSILMEIFIALENMKYQSLNAQDIYKEEIKTKSLLLIISIQKMISQGILPLSTSKKKSKQKFIDIDVNSIVSDIKHKLKNSPEIKQHPAVKQILLQINRYQREYEKMKELLPKIKLDATYSFVNNFIQVFDAIFESIRKNYSQIISEEQQKEENKKIHNLLPILFLKKLTPIYETQAKEVSRICSILAFAREERYKTREAVVALYNEKPQIMNTIERERKAYIELCNSIANIELEKKLKSNCYSRILEELKREIIVTLQKALKE